MAFCWKHVKKREETSKWKNSLNNKGHIGNVETVQETSSDTGIHSFTMYICVGY